MIGDRGTLALMSEVAQRPFLQKRRDSSAAMLPAFGGAYWCHWLTNSITVHADGNVTCGLDDPNANRSFGNVADVPVADIWRGAEYGRLAEGLAAGRRCSDCSLYSPLPQGESAPMRPAMPTTLIIEPTVKCNIRCINSACYENNDATIRTRSKSSLGLDQFCNVVDQLAKGLKTIYFFNYGDPFVNAAAEDMLAYARQRVPEAEIVTSTNGIPLAKMARAERVVRAAPDTITFTISGTNQDNYAVYHRQGRFDLAFAGMRNIEVAKRAMGAARPFVFWRYLLFRWNDTDAEVEDAIRLAAEIGVGSLRLYLTHEPINGASFRFAPGTPNFERYRDLIDCSVNYTRCIGIQEPDNHGLFPPEDIAGLGPAYWTSFRADILCDGSADAIRLSFATMRLHVSPERPTLVYLALPWGTFRVTIERSGAWVPIAIPIPEAERCDELRVLFSTPHHWFPAEEVGSPDLRCLGALCRLDTDQAKRHPTLAGWFDRAADSAPEGEAAEAARLRRVGAVSPLIDTPTGI